jgi:hypothetical protein
MKKYIDKQNRLKNALEKVQNKLANFKEISQNEFHSKFESLTEETKNEWRKIFDSWQWNEHHDLEDRLTERLQENHSLYHQWHYDNFGWSCF